MLHRSTPLAVVEGSDLFWALMKVLHHLRRRLSGETKMDELGLMACGEQVLSRRNNLVDTYMWVRVSNRDAVRQHACNSPRHRPEEITS